MPGFVGTHLDRPGRCQVGYRSHPDRSARLVAQVLSGLTRSDLGFALSACPNRFRSVWADLPRRVCWDRPGQCRVGVARRDQDRSPGLSPRLVRTEHGLPGLNWSDLDLACQLIPNLFQIGLGRPVAPGSSGLAWIGLACAVSAYPEPTRRAPEPTSLRRPAVALACPSAPQQPGTPQLSRLGSAATPIGLRVEPSPIALYCAGQPGSCETTRHPLSADLAGSAVRTDRAGHHGCCRPHRWVVCSLPHRLTGAGPDRAEPARSGLAALRVCRPGLPRGAYPRRALAACPCRVGLAASALPRRPFPRWACPRRGAGLARPSRSDPVPVAVPMRSESGRLHLAAEPNRMWSGGRRCPSPSIEARREGCGRTGPVPVRPCGPDQHRCGPCGPDQAVGRISALGPCGPVQAVGGGVQRLDRKHVSAGLSGPG
jgi:hypothetical protein